MVEEFTIVHPGREVIRPITLLSVVVAQSHREALIARLRRYSEENELAIWVGQNRVETDDIVASFWSESFRIVGRAKAEKSQGHLVMVLAFYRTYYQDLPEELATPLVESLKRHLSEISGIEIRQIK